MSSEPANEQVLTSTTTLPASDTLTIPSVLRVYRRLAPIYNWVFGAVFEEGRRATIQTLAARPGERVLEVGVGTGITLRSWPKHARVTAIDISPDMLAKARETCAKHRVTNVEVRQMDAQAMTFPDNSFDKIAAMYVVSVAPNLPALLKEIKRVCVPDGRICIVNHFAHRNRIVRQMERGLSSFAGFLGFETALPIEAITDQAGLRIHATRSVNWGGYWSLIEAENVK